MLTVLVVYLAFLMFLMTMFAGVWAVHTARDWFRRRNGARRLTRLIDTELEIAWLDRWLAGPVVQHPLERAPWRRP